MDFVSTKQAPEAIGPYSQAVITGNLVFTAGQIALDPRSMEMVGDDLAAQTDRVLTNLAAVLSEAGCTFSDVVKTTVYLADMADFPIMNEVYARHFGRRISTGVGRGLQSRREAPEAAWVGSIPTRSRQLPCRR